MVDDATMTARRARRSPAECAAMVAVLVALLVAGLTGCGGGDDGEGAAESAAGTPADDVRSVPVPDVTTATVAPLAPWQVLVAVARPEIALLETFDAPDGRSVQFEIPLINPWYFGGELALLVEEGRESDEWLRVGIPTRPNGTTAWIRRSDVDIRTHRIHAEVALGQHRLRVWDGDDLLVEAPAVIGKSSTPTPVGRFFVNARILHDNPTGAYGPWILSLSGFSEVLETFDGGLPELAIHGTNRPEQVGESRSNGCVRVTNEVIEQLSQLVPLGTPVDIVA
jgi:hypothetical protein